MKANKSTRPTLKTIADLSGLAVPTVSRALGDAPDIGQKTKEKIRRIAAEIGYVPDRAAVRLRTGKANVIALVLSTDNGIVNRTARLIASSAGALRGTGYHLYVTPFFPTEDSMFAIRHIVKSRAADSVILNQTKPDDERVDYLLQRNFPFVTHGRTNWSNQHGFYDFDNYEFIALAVHFLANRGRKRILVIAPPKDQNYAQEIIASLERAGADLGIWTGTLQGATSDDDTDVMLPALRQSLSEDARIDALIGCSTEAAMAATAVVESKSKIVGQEIDVLGKETTELLQLFRPGIISYFEDISDAGRFLGRAAIAACERSDDPPEQFLERPSSDKFINSTPLGISFPSGSLG